MTRPGQEQVAPAGPPMDNQGIAQALQVWWGWERGERGRALAHGALVRGGDTDAGAAVANLISLGVLTDVDVAPAGLSAVRANQAPVQYLLGRRWWAVRRALLDGASWAEVAALQVDEAELRAWYRRGVLQTGVDDVRDC